MTAAQASALAQSIDWQPVTEQDRAAITYAVAVGREEQLPLFACRATAGAGMHIGRFRADFDGCHIGFNGKEISVVPFEVLAPGWLDDWEGRIPAGSFIGGQRLVEPRAPRFDLSPLYSCRSIYQDSLQLGEIALGDRGCSFGYGGRQVTSLRYQVLMQAPWMTWVPGIVHQLPADAVAGGVEGGERFYICRAADHLGLHPGKIKQSAPGCSVVSEGHEIVARQFSLLVPRWIEGNAGTIPVTALPAGNERQDLLYVCRAQMRQSVEIGKINEALASCHVGMQGGEAPSRAYEVLSVP